MILKQSTKKVTYNFTKIECDKCHNIYTDIMDIQEFLIINFTGGFESVFGDGTEIKADICQHCLKKLLNGVYKIEKHI